MNVPAGSVEVRPWWQRRRQFSLAELIADGNRPTASAIAFAISLGTVLLVFAALGTARPELPAIIIYLVTLLTCSACRWPSTLAPSPASSRSWPGSTRPPSSCSSPAPTRPFLAILGGTRDGQLLAVLVWGAAMIGIALKLIVPQRFGRLADSALPRHRLERCSRVPDPGERVAPRQLLAAGRRRHHLFGPAIVFHLWERLKVQNVLWHVSWWPARSCICGPSSTAWC